MKEFWTYKITNFIIWEFQKLELGILKNLTTLMQPPLLVIKFTIWEGMVTPPKSKLCEF